MNKIKSLFIALVSIFSLILWSSSAFAQGGSSAFDPGYPEASSAGYHSMGWGTFEAGWLIGHRVYSPQGGELGQIEDLMIDRNDGHVALVILSGVRSFGAQFVAAPFSALERTGEDTFELNFDDFYADWSIVGLSTLPSTIDPLWLDSVYYSYGQKPYWTEGRTVPPDIMSYRTARPSILESVFMEKTAPVLIGATVQSKDQKEAARIGDLVIDSRYGRVAFLVLGRIAGRDDSQVAVPFDELSMSGNAFVLNTTVEKLAAAPSFNESADMGNREYAARVYTFFGLQPYWTEEQIH
jgi:sporulation protein YlmC with PRC-barrel domain